MIQSMTGYATGEVTVGNVAIHLELKSVNSRFLDITFRASDELRFLEMPVRELLAANVQRGKLECRLHLLPRASGGASEPTLDHGIATRLIALQRAALAAAPEAAPLSVAEILRWPGILGDDALDQTLVTSECQLLTKQVLDEFTASRRREGERLGAVLIERVTLMDDLVVKVEPMVPQALVDYRERLALRLREAVANLDEERIRQEIGIFAAKIDVAEELARLHTHLDEVRRILGKGGSVGKRLDFLMQELNREANTLASKSVSAEVTAIALELKLLIEQMREQVQNLE